MVKLATSSSTTTPGYRYPSNRKSFLEITPVTYSLTEGTNIPAPERTPPPSPPPADQIQPPTPGRGPLSSHPASSDNLFGDMMKRRAPVENSNGTSALRNQSQSNGTVFNTVPESPVPAVQRQQTPVSPEAQRRPSMRERLSLSSLRGRFGSSRTSLALPRPSQDQNMPPPSANGTYNSAKRPSSPSLMSTTTTAASTLDAGYGSPQPRALRRKKSAGDWFRRKSGMFLGGNNENAWDLDSVAEDNRPETRDSKRVKQSTDMGPPPHPSTYKPLTLPPLLPELRRDSFSGGELGWDESAFTRR